MYQHIVAQQPCQNCEEKDALIERLRAELERADICPVWGVYTRVGLERRLPHPDSGMAVIVMDIDFMHEANDKYGHAGVDLRMTLALRATDQAIIGRWQNGDELVVFAPSADALGLAVRLQTELWGQGLSATFAVVQGCTHASVGRGQLRIEAAKRAGERGRVFVV